MGNQVGATKLKTFKIDSSELFESSKVKTRRRATKNSVSNPLKQMPRCTFEGNIKEFQFPHCSVIFPRFFSVTFETLVASFKRGKMEQTKSHHFKVILELRVVTMNVAPFQMIFLIFNVISTDGFVGCFTIKMQFSSRCIFEGKFAHMRKESFLKIKIMLSHEKAALNIQKQFTPVGEVEKYFFRSHSELQTRCSLQTF